MSNSSLLHCIYRLLEANEFGVNCELAVDIIQDIFPHRFGYIDKQKAH